MKRQIEQGVLELSLTTLFLWKFNSSIKASYTQIVTNYPNIRIRTFRKSLSFIWRRFSPVCILKTGRKIEK